MSTTEQDQNKIIRNPDGKGGFKDNPQNINKGGRPKKEDSPTFWLRKFLSEVDPKTEDGKIRLQQLAEKLALEAVKGESWAMKEVFDRLDGKAPQTIKHEGEIQTGVLELAETIQNIYDASNPINEGTEESSD